MHNTCKTFGRAVKLITLGSKFGRLTVIKRSNQKRKDFRQVWKCRCDCGKIKHVTRTALVIGNTKSCGCLGRSHIKLLNQSRRLETETFNEVYIVYKTQAKQHGREFSLTRNEADLLFKGNCIYCGDKPSNSYYRERKGYIRSYMYNGIDRKDNTKGYSKSNSVSCCSICNVMKHTLTSREFIKRIKKIVRHHTN